MADTKAKIGTPAKGATPPATPPAGGGKVTTPGAAAPPSSTPPAAGNGTTAAAAGDTKKRNFLSPQKALAIQIAGLVAILSAEAIAALLTDDQKAQVKAASDMADELNSQTIKPVQDRIGVIKTELAALTADPTKLAEPGTIGKVKDYANELSRLQKRLETFTGAASSTV